jgi:hypothetical protein
MPYFIAMLRAMAEARSRSFDAPVVISLKMISSAARPPRSPQISSVNLLFDVVYWSSCGRNQVTPSAEPRETMLILWSGSECVHR